MKYRPRQPIVVETLEQRRLMSAGGFAHAQDPQTAYDSTGVLHLAYYDSAEHNLKYANRSAAGEWSAPVTVDASGDVGLHPSLAIDRDGRPGIAYRDASNADLKYAHLDPAGWAVTALDRKGDVGLAPSLGYDLKNRAMVSYYCPTGGAMRLGYLDGGKWKLKKLGKAGTVAHADSSLAFNTSGAWAVAFQQTNGTITYVAQTGPVSSRRSATASSVVVPPVVPLGLSQADLLKVGATKAAKPVDPLKKSKTSKLTKAMPGSAKVSLAFDPSGHAALSFFDAATGQLKLLRNTGRWSTTGLAAGGSAGSHVIVRPTIGVVDVGFSDASGVWFVRGDSGSITQLRGADNPFAVTVVPGAETLVSGYRDETDSLSFSSTLAPVSGLSAAAASASQINLAWSAPTSGGYVIERSSDGANFSAIGSADAGSSGFADTTADDLATYAYRVRTRDGFGNEALSGAAGATTPLAAPTHLRVVHGSSGASDLTWTDASGHESGYLVQRTLDGANFTTLADLPPGSVAYTDSTVPAGADPGYRVITYITNGPAAASEVAYLLEKPAAPTDLLAGPGTDPSATVDLVWKAAGSNADGYRIARSLDGVTFTDIATVGATADANGDLTFTDTQLPDGSGLPEDSLFTYRIRAFNAAGESAAVEVSTDVPTWLRAPTDLSATPVASGRIDLAWTNHSSVATGVLIGFSTNGQAWSLLDTVWDPTATSYSVTTDADGNPLHAGQTYSFWVAGVSADNSSDYSNFVSAVAS